MNEQWLSVVVVLLPLFAISAEWLIGLPGYWHPLYYFRLIAELIAQRVNRPENGVSQQRLAGHLSLLLMVSLPVITYWGLSVLADMPLLLNGVLLFFLLCWRPVMRDLKQTVAKLADQQEPLARIQLSAWVLRDTHQLQQAQITAAASESLILNLAHSWFGVLFWYALGGVYGALVYRLIDILHQCWNRKKPTFGHFGQPVDIIHQWLCWLPDQLISLLMCCFGAMGKNWQQRRLGFRWKRTSSGQLVGICACWLNAELGGQRFYQGKACSSALFGPINHPPLARDFSLLCQRCYFVACCFLLWVVYPILLCRYLVFGF
ncbi:cobalamin biosynthesis protein CobD/CbiB [Celerinatantimonas yamalensis]|uniref:Cobalamin biosynthesis protein n=1 Tax=Celerinatantimonas yamalensis TaxID=559956 RepID=A0ABW9GCF2_9GAMM